MDDQAATTDTARRPQSALDGPDPASGSPDGPATLWDQFAPPTRPVETVTLSARMGDPETSADAAASLTPGRLESLILAVLHGALTSDQIAARLPREHPPSVKTALSRLKNAGLVRDSGMLGESARGRTAIRWELS